MFGFVARFFAALSHFGIRFRLKSAKERALDKILAEQNVSATPERIELLRHAMQVRRAKQRILANLSDDDRRKLAVIALRAFLNEAPETRDGEPGESGRRDDKKRPAPDARPGRTFSGAR